MTTVIPVVRSRISLLSCVYVLVSLLHIACGLRHSGSTIGLEKTFRNRRFDPKSRFGVKVWRHANNELNRYRGCANLKINMNSDPTNYLTENSEVVPSSTWSPAARKAMVGLASIGAVETGLLSYVKFTKGSVGIQNLCSAVSGSEGSCGLVLDSSYASIAGIPLTFYGFCGTSCDHYNY